MTPTLGVLALFLAAQLSIGVWVARRIRTESDYLIAGRRLGPLLATFSIFATWFGAETVVAAAGNAYRDGVTVRTAEPYGYGLCLILMGAIFAIPLWRRKLTTLADLYRQRYGAGVERLAAIVLVPSSVLWAAAQIRAFGHVLASAGADLNLDVALALAAAVTIAYTAFGGLLVDAITDVIQGILVSLGLVVILGAVVAAHGGTGETFAAMSAAQSLRIAAAEPEPLLALIEEWAIPVCGSVIAAELVGRVIAARSPQVARNSSLLAGVMYIGIGTIPVVIGLAGVSLVPGLADPEQLVPAIARELLPGVLYAIFAAGLISAILSTVDSTLLISSGMLSHNLIVPLARVESEKARVRIARGGVVVLGMVAYALAYRSTGVFELVEQASAFGGAGALVTVSFALFSRFGGRAAAATALVSSMLAYIVAVVFDWPYPFLTSLATAFIGYVMIGIAEQRSMANQTRAAGDQ